MLFSQPMMFGRLQLLSLGCALRVSSEVLAYQEILPAAWHWLPYSAMTELAAVALFAIKLIATFLSDPPSRNSPAAGRVRERLVKHANSPPG